eukprot:Nk52_evm9s1607 gene=Nk52_evmTU9s1607
MVSRLASGAGSNDDGNDGVLTGLASSARSFSISKSLEEEYSGSDVESLFVWVYIGCGGLLVMVAIILGLCLQRSRYCSYGSSDWLEKGREYEGDNMIYGSRDKEEVAILYPWVDGGFSDCEEDYDGDSEKEQKNSYFSQCLGVSCCISKPKGEENEEHIQRK